MKVKILLTIGILILLIFLLIKFIPVQEYSESLIGDKLKESGFGDVTYQLDYANLTATSIKDIKIKSGKNLSIGQVMIKYNYKDLMDKRVNTIEINDLKINTDYVAGNFVLEDLQEKFNGKETKDNSSFDRLPFSKIVFNNAEFVINDLDRNREFIVPLRLNMNADILGSLIKFTGTVSNLENKVNFNITGEFDLNQKTGNVKFKLDAINFETGILQPDNILPFIRGSEIKSVSGSVGLDGSVSIDKDKVKPDINLSLADLSLSYGNTVISKASGEFKVISFTPFATADNQQIKIEAIDSILPLKDGDIVFDLKDDNKLHVRQMDWRLGDGKLYTKDSKFIIGEKSEYNFILNVEDVALSDVALLPEDEFSATGKLHGRIPFLIKGNDLFIKDGVLETSEPGIINYKPKYGALQASMSNPSVALVFNVLEDFHYDKLKLTLNSRDKDKLDANIAISGNNPKVEDGRFVKLNINLKGNIIDLLKSSVDVYQLPQTIIEQYTNGKIQ